MRKEGAASVYVFRFLRLLGDDRTPGAVPAALGDIRFGAERQPHFACGNPAGEGLFGRAPAERGQNQIIRDNTTVAVTEFIADGSAKLAQPHN